MHNMHMDAKRAIFYTCAPPPTLQVLIVLVIEIEFFWLVILFYHFL